MIMILNAIACKKKTIYCIITANGPWNYWEKTFDINAFSITENPRSFANIKKKKKKRDKDLTHLQIHTMPGDCHLWGTTEKCCAKMVYLYYLVT